eukprot:gene19634-26319_t
MDSFLLKVLALVKNRPPRHGGEPSMLPFDMLYSANGTDIHARVARSLRVNLQRVGMRSKHESDGASELWAKACDDRLLRSLMVLFITAPQDEKKHLMEAQIQCTIPNDPFKKTVMFYISAKNKGIHIKVPDIVGVEIPLFVMFRAMGIESDKQIVHYVAGDNVAIRDFLYFSVIDNNEIYSRAHTNT